MVFICLRFCCVGRIVSYVTEITRLKMDKKASKMDVLFIASWLKTENLISARSLAQKTSQEH